jgi:hypothetical protein
MPEPQALGGRGLTSQLELGLRGHFRPRCRRALRSSGVSPHVRRLCPRLPHWPQV